MRVDARARETARAATSRATDAIGGPTESRLTIERRTRSRDARTRRKILQRTKSLLRFLGLGHMRNMGAELPYRKRVEFMLVTIFGTTFDKNSYWYGAPDPDTFFATILNMAGANKAVSASDGSEIFRIKPGTTSYEVNRGKLRALGVSERTLRDLFARTEAADVQHQIEPVGPLEVPLPEAVMAYAAEDRSMTSDAPAEVETQEDAARMLVDLFGGSQMEQEEKTFTKLVTHGNTKVPIKVKKRTSGKRKNRLDTLRETADAATTKSVAETATTSASQDTLARTTTAKPGTNGRNRRKTDAPVRNSKGKELDLDDDDEPDDAVAAKPIPDDDDTHSKALEANLTRRFCLAPRDGSHRPLPFLDFDFDFGWDPDFEPKSIAQLHEDFEFFLIPEASGDDAPTCGAASDYPLLDAEAFNEFLSIFPSFEQNPELEHRRQRTRMLFSKFQAELHDILRGTEVAEEVLERLDVLRTTADKGLTRDFALRGE